MVEAAWWRGNVNERPILDKSVFDPIEDKAGQIFATGLGPCLNLRYLAPSPITPIPPTPTRKDRFLFYLSVPGHGFSSVHESSSSFFLAPLYIREPPINRVFPTRFSLFLPSFLPSFLFSSPSLGMEPTLLLSRHPPTPIRARVFQSNERVYTAPSNRNKSSLES